MFRRRLELSTVKYIHDFLKFQTVWCETIGFELPRGRGQTDRHMHGGIIHSELSPMERGLRTSTTLNARVRQRKNRDYLRRATETLKEIIKRVIKRINKTREIKRP